MPIGGKRRYRTSHTVFSVAFPLVLFAVCNALNIDKLSKWFANKDGLDLLGLSAYLLAGLCLFIAFFALFAHRRTIKPVAILLVILSGATTYFISKYNVAVDTSMIMNVVHTDTVEVGQLITLHMLPYVVFLMVLPALVILSVEITFQPAGRYLLASAKLFAVAFVVAIAALYLNYNSVIRAGNVSKKYIVYSLVPLNFLSGGLNAAYKSMKPWIEWGRKDVEIRGSVGSPGNLVVVGANRFKVTRVRKVTGMSRQAVAELFSDRGKPRLVLITCGDRNNLTGVYRTRIIVNAKLVRRR